MTGFNTKRLNSGNRTVTLGGMLVNNNINCKRIFNWHKQQNTQQSPFTMVWGIKHGQWAPPSHPFNTYTPYYSTQMYAS